MNLRNNIREEAQRSISSLAAPASSQSSFIHYIFKRKRNKKIVCIAAIASIFQFTLFKLLYPFPDFFSDSYNYIYSAYAHLDISIWPIGYSKFLAVFHWFTHSDTALIAFQYFLLETAALYFFFTMQYFYSLGKTSVTILFIFLFFNPLFLYLSNYVNSDPLFAALSLFWMSELLWIINRPALRQVFIQAILLFLAFTVRNNAYYYPLIAAIAFAVSRHRLWAKFAGALGGAILIVPFIIHSRNEAYEMTGTRQFSLFTGWQIANNALYIYDQIEVDSTTLPTNETKELNRLSLQFVKSIPAKFNYREYLGAYVGNYFIRQPDAPLKQFLWSNYKMTNEEYSRIIAWGKASVVYGQFGTTVIKHHPLAFIKYFILPNIKNYFLPPLEKLDLYNLGLNTVPSVVQDWFDYKTPDVWVVSKNIQAYILFILSPIFLVLNILFLGNCIWILVKKKYVRFNSANKNVLWLVTFFLFSNFSFSVLVTINVFRYQFFPMIVCMTSLLLLIELIDKEEMQTKSTIDQIKLKNINLELAE